MKNPLRLLFPAALLLAAPAPAAFAQVSPVSIRVEQITSTDSDKKGVKHEQSKSLKIHLTNSSRQDFSGLRVKYYFFAKDVKSRDTSVHKDGETTADVKAASSATVETPSVSSSYSEDSYQGKKGGKRGGGGGKKVEGTGDRLVGYGARLYDGDKLLTEFFSQPSYKELVGGGARP